MVLIPEIMIIHPAIWKQVSKMYRWYYKNDFEIQKIFQILDSSNWQVANLINLEEYLNGLTYEQGIDVIMDVLHIEDFWPTENDLINRRNRIKRIQFTSGLPSLLSTEPPEPSLPEQRLFAEELSSLLTNLCGLVYDKYTRTLSAQNKQGVHEIPRAFNNNLLVNIEFEEYFFRVIIQELNGVYRAGFYNSTLLLSRKLFENLLIKLLEHKYPRNIDGNLTLYYDDSQNRYRDFSVLIKVLRDRNADFNDGHSTIQRFLTKIEKLTEITNPTAHKLTFNASREDLISLEIEEMLELYKKIAELVLLNGIMK